LAILFDLIIHARTTPVKRLDYEVLSISDEADGSRSVRVRVVNTGNRPIHADDFSRPITIRMKNGSNIDSATVPPYGHPLDHCVARRAGGAVTLDPNLMNPKEQIVIDLRIGMYGELEFLAHFAGQMEPMRDLKEIRRKDSSTSRGFLYLAAGLFVFSAAMGYSDFVNAGSGGVVASGLIGGGTGVVLLVLDPFQRE
jgi:hypothetical protein